MPETAVASIAAAREAVAETEKAEADLAEVRERRDRAIATLHDDGMSAPAIAREIGMSVSNVRWIVKTRRTT